MRDAGDLSALRGSVGDRGGAGPGLAEASAALDEVAAELDAVTESQRKAFGDLADDMEAVQQFRQDTILNTADVAGELMDMIAKARAESGTVATREDQAEKVRAANADKKRVIGDIVAGDGRVESLNSEVVELRRQIEDESVSESERRRAVASTLPIMSRTLKLYELATKTKVYNKREHMTEGFVARTGANSTAEEIGGGNEITPFKFDMSQMSRLEAVNKLWSLI